MSRIGKLPIIIPQEVNVESDGLGIKVTGPKGNISKTFIGDIAINIVNNKVIVTPLNNSKHAKSMWGTARNIINSMIIGTSIGFRKELEINGVGYRAAIKNDYLNLSLGKSHNTKIKIPNSITIEAPKPNVIFIEGVNKEELGQFIARIIKERPPEPYKGKGIKFKGQYIERKQGKKK